MNEENNNINQETANDTLVKEEVQQTPITEEKTPKKKTGLCITIILIGLILIGTGLFLFFGTDLFKKEDKKEKGNETKDEVNEVDKFVGIYVNNEDKLIIRKTSTRGFYYILGGNFEGTAIVTGDTAKQNDLFKEEEYFEFKIVEGGIDVSYHAGEDVSVAVETGKYTKIAEYSKDNVYKEVIGDPSYLTSKYSGIFKSGDIELYLYQINEKQVKVDTKGKLSFSKDFEIVSDNKLVAKSFFDENETEFEITFNDKQFTLTANENVFGFDEDDKQFALTYTFANQVTKEMILNNFYSRY